MLILSSLLSSLISLVYKCVFHEGEGVTQTIKQADNLCLLDSSLREKEYDQYISFHLTMIMSADFQRLIPFSK